MRGTRSDVLLSTYRWLACVNSICTNFFVSFQKIVTQEISFSLILIRCWCIFFSESLFHVIHLYNYSIMNIVKDVISTVVKCGMILYWNKSAFECTSVFLDIANKAWITQFNVFFMYIQYGNNLHVGFNFASFAYTFDVKIEN